MFRLYIEPPTSRLLYISTLAEGPLSALLEVSVAILAFVSTLMLESAGWGMISMLTAVAWAALTMFKGTAPWKWDLPAV